MAWERTTAALAAGHRPGAECRRARFRDFCAAWLAGNPERVGPAALLAATLEAQWHADRLTEERLP